MYQVMLTGPAYLLYEVLEFLLGAYLWVVIAAVVMSWLLVLNALNYHNNFVHAVVRILDALTEPVFRLIRRILPPIGGLDLSPLVVFLVILVLQKWAVPQLAILIGSVTG